VFQHAFRRAVLKNNEAAIPLVGVMPAPSGLDKTPAERLMSQYGAGRAPQGSRTEAEADKSTARRQMDVALRKGDTAKAHEIFDQGKKDGILGPHDYSNAVRKAQHEPLVNNFQHLTYEQAVRVMKLADDAEREKLAPMMAKKQAAHMREHPEPA
jgi:hypothetical protein